MTRRITKVIMNSQGQSQGVPENVKGAIHVHVKTLNLCHVVNNMFGLVGTSCRNAVLHPVSKAC